MPDFDDIRALHEGISGERYRDEVDAVLSEETPGHPLDGDEAKAEHRRLLGWFYGERDKQAENRLEMLMDHDFYDGLQWDAEDAAVLRERGQMPLVYNEVAPMVDWLIGTERRTRVDWNVLPRTEDDVVAADIKERVLKYVADVNRVPFARSRAFADAVKGGVGWVDDGIRDDPTQDILYSKYEDWRNVLWDSSSYELDLSDARYVFRWRWVDEDVALMMFPDRGDEIRRAVEEVSVYQDEDGGWFLNEKLAGSAGRGGVVFASGHGRVGDTTRRRIKLIECQYRKPVQQKIVADGPLKGAFFHESDLPLAEVVANEQASLIDRVAMRVHIAVFTESAMLSMGPSTFRHNRFSLTPLWCYRRSRDRLPYGVVRRVRDIQQDLNKRASKALFMLNTNQVIMDAGAVDDVNVARDEVDRPDGLIVKNPGKDFLIRRDTDAATGQLQMMSLAAQSIQKSAGVNNENLGRQTNAISGAAITARQQQGAVGTTEPFDNLRLAVQIQGEKQLSLTEQFYTEEKVIRLTGAKGRINWLRINQPEVQVDGSVRWINDITSSMADFVVSEQDYAGTLRQTMFDSINQLATRLPPEISLKLLRIAFDFSDMPNKDEITEAIRAMTGEQDPNKELTPEEEAQIQSQMQMQAEAMQMQRETAMAALEEQRARVREINARAQKVEREAAGHGEGAADLEQQLRVVQRQAADQIDVLAGELRQVQAKMTNRLLSLDRNNDVALETARIEADAKIRVAEIQAASNRKLDTLEKRLEAMSPSVHERKEK